MAWLDKRISGIYLRDRNPDYCRPLGKVSHKIAQTERRKFEREKEEGLAQEGELGKRMEEVYSQYLAFLERNDYSPKTIHNLKDDVLPFVKTIGRVKHLTHDAIKAHKEYLETFKREEGRKYSIDTIAHRLRAIKAFCSWMVDEKIFKRSPFEVSIPEGRKDAGRALSGKQVHALFEHWPKETIYNGRTGKQNISKLFFEIVFYGGTRLTETLGDEENIDAYPGAQFENLDRKRGVLKIEKAKGKENREVALPVFIVKRVPHGVGPIFRGKINEATLRVHLALAAKDAGITGRFRIHDGRVSSATEWLRKNKDIKSAMGQFGWKSERMALHYNKVATEERIAQAQKITYR